MKTRISRIRLLGSAAVVLAALLAGCGGDEDHATHEEPGAHEGHEHMKPPGEAADTSGLEGLSPADQKLALAQKVCPVSGEALGEMGTPMKVEAEGRTVFLCCKACRPKFEKDPQKYLAKLDAAGR